MNKCVHFQKEYYPVENYIETFCNKTEAVNFHCPTNCPQHLDKQTILDKLNFCTANCYYITDEDYFDWTAQQLVNLGLSYEDAVYYMYHTEELK